MDELKTAILIDGSDNPPALRIKESDKQNYISQGRAGEKPRNFKFVRSATVRVGNEDRTAFLYRLEGGSFSDADFEAMAKSEADKHLNPEKYAKVQSRPLDNDERAELERLRKMVGK